jgi:hypothetical protein
MISMDSIVYRVSFNSVAVVFLYSGVEQIHLWMVDSAPCLSSATTVASNKILSDSHSDRAPITFSLFHCILSSSYHIVKSCFCKLTFGRQIGFFVRDCFFNTLSFVYLH